MPAHLAKRHALPTYWTQLALSTLLLASLAACSKGDAKTDGGGFGNMPPPKVGVITLAPHDFPVTLEYPGQTFGSKEVEVRARVGGILERRLYTEGGAVRAGQALFSLDPKPLQTQLAASEAEVAGAQARLEQAQREVNRLKPLLVDKAVSQQEADNALSNQQIAAANLQAAKAKQRQVQLDLSYTQVTAPVSGMSSRALKSEGSLVSTADSLLTTIVQLDPLYVSFGRSENEQNQLERDAAAGRLQLPAHNAWSVQLHHNDGSLLASGGKLNFADSRVNNQTGSVEMRAELPNPGQKLRSGQFVRVTLSGAVRAGAIAVPQSAVLDGPTSKIVMVLAEKDGKPTFAPRPVEVGEWTTVGQTRLWIINKGLQAGDKVIIDNLSKIGRMPPGSPVEPVSPEVSAAAQSAAAAEAMKKGH